MALFGLLAIVEGRRLGVGVLTSMRPGFVPLALGVLLVILGLVIAFTRTASMELPDIAAVIPEWRGWVCIILGAVGFIVVGSRAGLVLAALICVFVSALGDRTTNLKQAAVLAIGVAGFSVVLFHFLLGLSIQLFWW